jgi:transcriptional regulator PpsR
MRAFESPDLSLGDLRADVAGRLLAAASDVALILDDDGVIRDLAFGSEDLLSEGYYDWIGKPWVATVTVESRPKVEALLRESRANAVPRWRHINHPSPQGPDLPMSYSAVALPPSTGVDRKSVRSVVFGRDLRASSVLQQRLISSQQAMERDYWRLRHMETRYRSLFQTVGEAVLIVDAATGKVEEANPAAAALFGSVSLRAGWLLGDSFEAPVDTRPEERVQAMLERVRATGRSEGVPARLSGRAEPVRVQASLFRQEKTAHLLVRVIQASVATREAAADDRDAVLRLVERAPDALVVTDLEGRVLTANNAFIELAQLPNEEQVRGQPLERWLGRTGVDLNVLISTLRQRSVVRLFSTVLRGEFGTATDVELSAVSVADGDPPCLGFTIRDVSRRLVEARPQGADREMPRSVGQMTELVGRLPLKDIVRDTTDLIEQLCIEAALELTRDNRALAAEMLGLSRQSLYVKMRRFNIGDLAPVPDPE